MDYIFKGVKGKQWEKDTYTSNISFAQISEICRVDPEVQRAANKEKMENIADYIMDALLGKRFMAGFNAIVTSLRYATLRYNEETSEVQISTRGKLFISDGQHREGGIEIALRRVETELDKAREANDTEAMEYWENILEKFENMTIPVVIFTGLTKDEEKQLFHDLNNLGTAVTATQALHLDQTDPFNRMAKQLGVEIPKLKKYGIDTTSKVLSDKKTEVATLATWNSCIRILLNGPSEEKKDWNNDWDYEEKKSIVKEFWSNILDVLPDDYTNKEKYMITKAAFIQGLAAWGHKLIFEDKTPNWKSVVYELHDFDWGYTNDIYAKYNGGSIQEKKNRRTKETTQRFYFKGTRAAINSIPQALNDYVTRPVKI